MRRSRSVQPRFNRIAKESGALPPGEISANFGQPPEVASPLTRNTSLRKFTGSAGGFTLIEVLVALTVLSLSLAIIYAVFSASIRGNRVAEEYEQATLIAESKLNSMGIEEPIQEGSTSGNWNDRFRWNAVVAPYHEQGRDETKDVLRRPLTVTVTVSWGDPGDVKSVALTTLRLVPKS